MAEAMLNALGKGRFAAYSAGSHPNGQVNPWSLRTLEEIGVSTRGVRSKGWEEFARPSAPAMDFIITVCDNAAAETCPIWPGKPATAHWGVPDPASVKGDDPKVAMAFREAMLALRRRIELLLSLPLEDMDNAAVQAKLKEIGSK